MGRLLAGYWAQLRYRTRSRRASPRNHTDLKSADTPQEQLLKIRHALVDRIWQGLFVVALLGAPVSVARSIFTGWLPLYGFHVGMALLVVAVYLFRARISLAVRSALILLIFWGIGLAGVFTLGVLGAGYWWLVLSSLLVSTLYSIRAGVVCAVAVTAILAGAGFISGTLQAAVDPSAYIVSPAAAALLAATIDALHRFQAIAVYQRTTVELLRRCTSSDLIQLATHIAHRPAVADACCGPPQISCMQRPRQEKGGFCSSISMASRW